VDAFAEAGRGAGFAWTEDYNGPQQEGFGRLQMTIRNGRRHSAAGAYLRPALKRGNVEIQVHAHATRLIFDGTRCVGVEYRKDGKLCVAHAAREVICAGGVINSAQLLMLSGIGDPEELAPLGIAARVALPGVGRNLQDHVSASLVWGRNEPGPFQAALRLDRIGPAVISAYLFGRGFASDVPGGVTAFLRSESSAPWPDLQYLFTAAPFGVGPWFPGWRKPFADGFACRTVLLQPESRGRVRLASADPFAAPRIHQNFLAAEADWRRLRQGIRMLREVMAQPSIASFIGRQIAPGPGQDGDEAIDAHIRKTAITVHHPLGTCAMGPDGDPMAVVDPELRVHGTEGLRVVDASVMPRAVSGNINAAVIMIAERAADLIRGRQLLAPARLEQPHQAALAAA
jgi:choline dehydrogenase/4-pyridoxate dehydrogenase